MHICAYMLKAECRHDTACIRTFTSIFSKVALILYHEVHVRGVHTLRAADCPRMLNFPWPLHLCITRLSLLDTAQRPAPGMRCTYTPWACVYTHSVCLRCIYTYRMQEVYIRTSHADGVYIHIVHRKRTYTPYAGVRTLEKKYVDVVLLCIYTARLRLFDVIRASVGIEDEFLQYAPTQTFQTISIYALAW